MRNDYYSRNENYRYKKPVTHTEANTFDPEQAPTWLWKQWINILRMRSDGIPFLGFTWYSLIDQIDWDNGLTELNNNVIACGLYDLDRKPRTVSGSYKMLLKEYGQITIINV